MNKYTNNIAESEAVLLGLHKLRAMGVQNCILKIDSKVIAGQIEKECIARDDTLERYLALIRRMENYFRRFSVEYIERAKNTEADKLVKTATRITTLPPDVFFQTLEDSSVKIVEPETRIVNVIQGEYWRAPIIAYLCHHYEPDNNIELLRM
jgi:ribonuclease HI